MGYFFWIVGQWGLIDLQALEAIANAIGYTPELDGKTSLKILNIWGLKPE